MKAMWHVVVRDDKGAEVTDAKIALIKKADVAGKDFPFDTAATTHSHKGKGAYEPDAEIAPAAGKWFLAVNRKGSSAAVQPFTVFGRIPASQFVQSGAYSDTITMTLTFDGRCSAGIGSMIVVNPDGWFVTCAHMIAGANEVFLADQAARAYRAIS